MTKGKVIQIGFLIAILGFIIVKSAPLLGFDNVINTSISNFILIIIVMIWILSYGYRVTSGKMTFMEQRKRYRKKYDEVMEEKLKIKFDNLSDEEQEKLLKKIDK